MTREDIIRMADEQGLIDYFDLDGDSVGQLMLYNLVLDCISVEREACAQFLESTQLGSLPNDTALHYARLLKGFAEGIRARGQA